MDTLDVEPEAENYAQLVDVQASQMLRAWIIVVGSDEVYMVASYWQAGDGLSAGPLKPVCW